MPPRRSAPRRKSSQPTRRPSTAPPRPPPAGKALPIEVDPRQIEQTLARVRAELLRWANKGRYTRVRFKFRGKQLLPDLPLAAVLAAEGLTFYWGGILRALIFNVAGKAVLDVELVNDSEKRIAKGKEHLLAGELDQALACFREAVAMDEDNPASHLNLGVALKLGGEREAARSAFERARSLDPDGPVGQEAARLLAGVPSVRSSASGSD